MKEIYLVFTRDHNQWTNEMVDYVFVHELKRIFGSGLSTQITHYTGRTSEWWRFVDEMKGWKEAVIHRKLSDSIFRNKAEKEFRKQVAQLRKLISISPTKIKKGTALLRQVKMLFIKMYPYYLLALFLPSPWREDFTNAHPKDFKKVLENFFESRERSEGLLKEVTNFMRSWLGPMLEKKGYPFEYIKLLSVDEVEEFVKDDVLPTMKVLNERSKGFVHMNSKIIPVKDFVAFLKKRNIFARKEQAQISDSVSGSTAYIGKTVRGRVKVVLNASEMKGFVKGMILVSPMTAPENLAIMKIAAAIVTDEGGLTCHAAIVARELKKPCVIGTKIATRVFKDGDMVEVDAVKGIVRKI